MKCPVCGADNKESQMYCTSCGASLSGPQSISLGNEINEKSNNDIQMITGIDFSSLSKEKQPVKKNSYSSKETEPQKAKKSLPNIMPLVSSIITILLGVLCIILYINNRKLLQNNQPCNCPKTEKCEVNHSNIQGIYGATSKYTFYLPDGWFYDENGGETVITSDKAAVVIKGSEEGKNDQATSSSVRTIYQEAGYNNVEIKEDVLERRKIVYILYNANNVYFGDFYYQYDSGIYLYGQISSTNAANVIHADVKSILSTITLDTKKSYNVAKAPVPYNKIIGLLK